MTVALLKNNATIVHAVDGDVLPSGIYDDGGLWFSGDAPVGWTSGSYSVVSASYSDAPPANSVQTGFDLANSTINAGPPVTASIKRTWEMVTPSVPFDITRAQALLAILYGGISADPEGMIAAAIASIPDATQRTALTIKFKADRWLVSDLVANARLLNMTADQVTALAIAAQAY